MRPEVAKALLEQNRATLSKYKVGQNVILHTSLENIELKKYGTIVGFALNSVDEIILEIRIAVKYEHPHEPEIVKIHPLNRLMIVEVL